MARIRFKGDHNLVGDVVYMAGDVVELDDREAEYHVDGGFADLTDEEPRRKVTAPKKTASAGGAAASA
jgi:hypothetical protein